MDARRGRWLQLDGFLLFSLSVIVLGGLLGEMEMGTRVSAIVALPFVLVFPGYALVMLFFPRQGSPPKPIGETGEKVIERRGIDTIERLALGIGVSVTIIPFVAFVLATTPLGISAATALGSLATITLVGTILGLGRRLVIPADDRYVLPQLVSKQNLGSTEGILGVAVTITLACSIIIAVVAMGFVLANPQTGAEFTDVYLLGEEEDEPVASSYPEEIVAGESVTYGIGIQNAEGEQTNYSVLVHLEEIDSNGDIVDSETLFEQSVQLENGERAEEMVEVIPTLTGEDLRVSVYVFTDRVPWQPDHDNAPYSLHTWLTVTAGE